MAAEEATLPIRFGKRLAQSDKVTRDQGFMAMTVWLRRHPELERMDYLKLWKGIAMAHWMCDRPRAQQDLCVKIALLIKEVPGPKQYMWLETFWVTMRDLWEKVDAHRMSKFMLLVRVVVAESFQALGRAGWSCTMARAFAEVSVAGMQASEEGSTTAGTKSLGLTMHFNNVFWSELLPQLEVEPEIPEEAISALVDPFIIIARTTASASLLTNIHASVLQAAPPQVRRFLARRLRAEVASGKTSKKNSLALIATAEQLEARGAASEEEKHEDLEEEGPGDG